MGNIDQIALYLATVTASAFLLDAAIGDPPGLPHPVRWIGAFITYLDNRLRPMGRSRAGAERALGALMATTVVVATAAFTMVLLLLSYYLSFALFMALSVYVGWAALSVKSLGEEATAVVGALDCGAGCDGGDEGGREGGIDAARGRLAMIVGRDTDSLDEAGVMRAVVETVSENTSDGVVAPLLYMAIGGPVLAMAYKATNTLDSMVGYKNKKYLHFGRFSARLDDAANYVPARVTAVFMVVASFILGFDWRRAMRSIGRYGQAHPSPNAGLPQAAVAGALHLRLGGPASYGGVVAAKAYIGDGGDEVAPVGREAVVSTVGVMWLTAIITVTSVLLFHLAVFSAFA